MKRFSGCFIALSLAVFAFIAVSCMSDGGSLSTDGTGEKEGTGDIVVNPVIDTKPFEEEIAGLKKELEDKNEAIAKSIEEANKKYQEALEQLKAEQATDAAAQEKIDEQSAKTSAALAKYTAAKADLTAAKAALQAAKNQFESLKTAKQQADMAKSNVKKIDITIQRAGAWEYDGSKKSEIPFNPNGFFELKFCSDKTCTDTVVYKISTQPDTSKDVVNTLSTIGGTLKWSVDMNSQLPSSYTSYWQLCHTGSDFDLGGIYLKIDGKPAYNLLSSGRVILKDQCLNFGKDDLAFAVYSSTQGGDNDGTNSSIILNVPCVDNDCNKALGGYKSYWNQSNPNELKRADSTTGNAEGLHMEQKDDHVALFLDDRWNNHGRDDNEAFFFYLDETGVNTDGKFSLETLGGDHWEFNYVVAMLYKPAEDTWLKDGTPKRKIIHITKGDYGISTDTDEGTAKVDMSSGEFEVSEDFNSVTLTREGDKIDTDHNDDNNTYEKILPKNDRPKGEAYKISLVESKDAPAICGANAVEFITISTSACEEALKSLESSTLKTAAEAGTNVLNCNPLESYYNAQALALGCQVSAIANETQLYTDAAKVLDKTAEACLVGTENQSKTIVERRIEYVLQSKTAECKSGIDAIISAYDTCVATPAETVTE